jgi:hypothetical protein
MYIAFSQVGPLVATRALSIRVARVPPFLGVTPCTLKP